jgi:hypothetical protein
MQQMYMAASGVPSTSRFSSTWTLIPFPFRRVVSRFPQRDPRIQRHPMRSKHHMQRQADRSGFADRGDMPPERRPLAFRPVVVGTCTVLCWCWRNEDSCRGRGLLPARTRGGWWWRARRPRPQRTTAARYGIPGQSNKRPLYRVRLTSSSDACRGSCFFDSRTT